MKWTSKDDDFIRENAHRLKDEVAARQLGEAHGVILTVDAYRKRRQGLGIKKKPGRGVCTVDEIADKGRKTIDELSRLAEKLLL